MIGKSSNAASKIISARKKRNAAGEPLEVSGPVTSLDLDVSKPENKKPVGAVLAVVKVLQYLSDNLQPIGASQLAKQIDLYPSTCFNILRTLAQADLVAFDQHTKKYSIGLGVINFVHGLFSQGGFISKVQSDLHEIARRGGFSTTLWRIMPDGNNVVVASAASGRVAQVYINVGERLPQFVGASGRVIAAFSTVDEAQLRMKFDELRWDVPLSFAAYLEGVEKARAKGWAIDNGNFRSGLVTVAAPVFDPSGKIRMTIAAHMFKDQYSAQDIESIAVRMVELANKIGIAGSLTDYR